MPGLFALVVAALFTGAAIYINLVEQPARLLLDDRALLAEWKPAYRRGFAMQASLAVLSGLSGLASWWMANIPAALAGAIMILANWPYTLLVIMPVNRRLLATSDDNASATTRELIVRWGRLHAVRSLFGAGATGLFMLALALTR